MTISIRLSSVIPMVLILSAIMVLPAGAFAKTPHTVDFNRGSNDSLTNRAPSYMGEGANLGPGCDPKDASDWAGHACRANSGEKKMVGEEGFEPSNS